MISKAEFLPKYNIKEEDFIKTGLDWSMLERIYDNYEEKSREPEFVKIPEFISASLMSCKDVHSVRFRIKSGEHLIDKIIRKKLDFPKRVITLDNYLTRITDLIGVRAIHLYKEQWLGIHQFINKRWKQKETPMAYYRKGDEETKEYKEHGCRIQAHKYGYRSIHYLIIVDLGIEEKQIVEVQVRTIFEEGWSEVDHKIRYPNYMDIDILKKSSWILNGLSGNADEMTTFMKSLKDVFISQAKQSPEPTNQENTMELLTDLERKMKHLPQKTENKKKMLEMIERLKMGITANSGSNYYDIAEFLMKT